MNTSSNKLAPKVVCGKILECEIGKPARVEIYGVGVMRTSAVEHTIEHRSGFTEIMTKNSTYHIYAKDSRSN